MSRFLLLLWVAGLCHSGPGAEAANPPMFRAGASAIDIAPRKFPVVVNAMFEQRSATKVHHPLHSRALVLDNGKVQLAIVVVDSCMLPRALLDRAKAEAHILTRIAPERILISATHTHSASNWPPENPGNRGSGPRMGMPKPFCARNRYATGMIYLNGNPLPELLARNSLTQSKSPTALLFAGERGGRFGLEGKLDEIAIYTHPLSKAQIARHAAQGLKPLRVQMNSATQPH